MKKRSEDSRVEPGFLVPAVERMLKLISRASVYRWITRRMQGTGRWPDDEELIPFWFAEAYVLSWFFLLTLAFCFVSVGSSLWYICLILAGYRLFDLGQGLASIMVFASRRRQDDQGGFILARDPIRWVLLTLVNLGEIALYFSFAYLTWGDRFDPLIDTQIAALYQSFAVFVAGGGSAPTSERARVIVIFQLCYFVLFLVIVAPVILSPIRAKELTGEVLGEVLDKDVEPDKRT